MLKIISQNIVYEVESWDSIIFKGIGVNSDKMKQFGVRHFDWRLVLLNPINNKTNVKVVYITSDYLIEKGV